MAEWTEYTRNEAKVVWKPGRMYEWTFATKGSSFERWAQETYPEIAPLAPRIRFLDEKPTEEKKVEKKMKKTKFDVNTAQVGDKIPTGTIVYKKVVSGHGNEAILTGVVTEAGIVTTHGALDKNRVKGLMPVSIVTKCYNKIPVGKAYSKGGYNTEELEVYGYGEFVDLAWSTIDGKGKNKQHPNGIAYKVGKRVSVRDFDTSTKQCSAGIHVYLTREGAENH